MKAHPNPDPAFALTRSRGDFICLLKFSYAVIKRAALGLEYYGAYGPLTNWDPFRNQQQMFLPAVDIDFGPNWEFNFGVGIGATQATDHLLVKMIVGYRINNKAAKNP